MWLDKVKLQRIFFKLLSKATEDLGEAFTISCIVTCHTEEDDTFLLIQIDVHRKDSPEKKEHDEIAKKNFWNFQMLCIQQDSLPQLTNTDLTIVHQIAKTIGGHIVINDFGPKGKQYHLLQKVLSPNIQINGSFNNKTNRSSPGELVRRGNTLENLLNNLEFSG